MALCEQGYLCDVCGQEVEEMTDSDLYLRYVLGEVHPEQLHLLRERHIRCNPVTAQFIVDPGFEPVGGNLLSILDDGHERKKIDPAANNRGQVWKLDEETHTATLMHNADLGVYAVAVGSAQSLKNGGYTFEAGFINPASVYSRAVETSADGKVVYALQVEGVIVYRSFRVADMYSAPAK